MREITNHEVLEVSGGMPSPVKYDAINFELPESDSASDYLSELLATSRSMRDGLIFN